MICITCLFSPLPELSNTDDDLPKMINSVSDGLIEVFGIVSSFHIAQLQMGISKPVRIGQAKQVKVCIAYYPNIALR